MSSVQRLVDALNADGIRAEAFDVFFSSELRDRFAGGYARNDDAEFYVLLEDDDSGWSRRVTIPNDDNAPAVILAWLKEGRRP